MLLLLKERFLTGDIYVKIDIIAALIVVICAWLIIVSVFMNFMDAQKADKVRHEKKHLVATASMSLFYLFYYLLLRFQIGGFRIADPMLRLTLIFIGLTVLITGTAVNLLGRLSLGHNWGDQIRIYHGHQLVNRGVYRLVRHPLYASLIWIFYAGCLIYPNYAGFLANTAVFLPMMFYRARQEEEILIREFPEYINYQKEVGMFMPIFRRRNDGK